MKLLSRFVFAAVFSLVSLLAINACKKPTDDINLIVNTSTLSKAPTLLQFVNANPTSNTAIPASFAVTISGANAALVQVDGGGTNFTATNGILPLSLTKSANPSIANPLTYHIYVNVPGFMPVSKTIVVTSNAASAPVIPLVEYASPANGTATVVQQSTVSAGTSSAVSINTSANTSTTEASNVSIPSGTQLLDANGSLINSSQLKSSVVFFGTGNTSSYNALPGGLNPSNAIGPNGQALPAGTSFVTAGLLSINMVAGSTAVKGFSKPVTLTMEINSNLVNPQTKQQVAVGDAIPIWSLNEQTGQWKYETTANVIRKGNKLAVTFPITHLSSWSADWYGASCSSTLTVNMHTAQQLNGDFLVSLTTANEQPVSLTAVSQIKEGVQAVLSDIPADAGDLKVVVYARSGNSLTKLGETPTFGACGKGWVEVTLATQPTVNYIKTMVNVVAKCSNQQVVAYPSTWLVLKNTTTGESTNVYMTDGVATTNLVDGNSYSITTTYAGKTYNSSAFKLDKSAGVAIPAVNGLSGTTRYDAVSNTVVVDATFVLTDCK
ncbi:hypothetical protein [Mucilaginibacter sp. PAMB04168]|uniref:hypothetical protein n=1 Tax=Mucilaginibacter sp. PAMB04168 TaxID=3138567 RepID=UPI0031F6472F